MRRQHTVHSIRLIEEKLLNMIAEKSEVIDRILDQYIVEMFDKLTLPEFSDFIVAHDPNVLT
jgi:hypothetical protein